MIIHKVSIAICTRNRANSLALTLEAINDCIVPPDIQLDILVVDNGSDDHTKQLVKKIASNQPNLRYIYESKIGLSTARNTAINNIDADVVIFTDDDVRPGKNWLDAMTRPILEGVADILGGEVLIPADLKRPWMTSLHLSCFATPVSWGSEFALIGANMSFSRKAISSISEFDTELGAGKLGSWEEILFVMQLISLGYRAKCGSIDSYVHHYFDVNRLKTTAMVKQALGAGRSMAFVDYHWAHKKLNFTWFRFIKACLVLFYLHIRYKKSLYNDEGLCDVLWFQYNKIAYLRQFNKESQRRYKY